MNIGSTTIYVNGKEVILNW